MFENLTVAERVRVAKDRTQRVVDHVLYLLELHENNAIILYSTTLSSQISASFAANAFNVFQRGMHQFEIVRLCALWDRAGLEKENIPTIIELIDHPDIIESLADETAAHWQNLGGAILNPSEDPELSAIEADALQGSNEEFGRQQAQKAREGLRKAIVESRTIRASPKCASIVNLRDKHLAHSLSETRREQKSGPPPPMQYGDEREVLDATLPIVEALYCWVNGTSFSFEDSRAIDRKNAEALWKACTFNITR
jgi:AbiU2